MYSTLSRKQIVGLLWADQNLRDFGSYHRLLTSSERQSLVNIMIREDINSNDFPYYELLSSNQFRLDNVEGELIE